MEGTQMKTVLAKHIGARVKLKLSGGHELEGVLREVTDEIAHLSELTGADFFDADVSLQHVSALVVRVRTK
ncbi:MAG: hypothetical protein K1Y01_09800 [Vicinamibacteria bacterium]|nr:hypothetical protein [Vicinamibacteria bacterium]